MIEEALDAMGDAIVVFDREGRIVAANARARDVAGITIDIARGRRLGELGRHSDHFREHANFYALMDTVIGELMEAGCSHSDDDASRISLEGELVPVSLRLDPIVRDGAVIGAVLTLRDHVFEASLMFRRASVGMVHVDRNGQVREANDALLDLLGVDQLDLRAKPFTDIVHPDDLEPVRRALEHVLTTQESGRRLEARVVRGDGALRWVDLSIAGNGLGNDRTGGACAILQDITARVLLAEELADAHERLRELAHHDPLTGLANRARLADDLRDAQRHAADTGAHVAVLFIDLDGFKLVNDTDGHHAGDQLLVQAAERLVRLLRPGDLAARIGGDEFVVCCPQLAADTAVADREAESIAERVREALTAPFQVGGRSWTIGASIGIALSPAGTDDPDELLRLADVAMYRTKQRR